MRISTVVSIAAFTLLSSLAEAQSTGTLTGTVVDPAGAVVVNADVACRNTQTDFTYNVKTNGEGLFRFPNLPIGTYELLVNHPGFERLVRSGIEMLTGRTIDVPLELKVGETNQSVEVTAAAPIIQTTSSEVETTFASQNTRELPLNGRNALQLVVLTPGARLSSIGTQGNQQQNTGVTTNGLRSLDNNYQLDGALFMDRFFNAAPTLPNPDALEEFTVKSSNYGASESGAGATIQLSTRGGTNKFHGSAFEFLRNDYFDARNFFAKVTTPFKRNQFGGSAGGPIIKDRTFFFASAQDTQASGGATPNTSTVPNAAMRGGNFTGLKTIVDPTTSQPFPGNQIPISRFDPLSVKLLPIVPLPNVGSLLAAQTPNTNILDSQFISRIDHTLTSKDHLTGRYFYDEFDYNRLTSAFDTIYARNFFRNQSVSASDTHTFSPNFILLESFGWTRVSRTQIPTEPVTLSALGQNVPPGVTGAAPELRVNASGYFNLFSGGGLGSHTSTFSYRTRFTLAKGRHFIQFGIDIEHDLMYSYDTSFSSGTTTFNGSRTSSNAIPGSGDSFADFLLGLPNDFNQGGRTPQNFHENKFQPWIQDDWKIFPRLTLNFGLRYEPWLPPVNSLAPGVAFVPGVQSTVAPFAPKGLLFSGDPGVSDSVFPRNWKNFAPRFGFAWDVRGNGKTVVRSAYGIFYRSIPLNLVRTSASGSAFTSLNFDIPNPPSFQDPYANTPGGSPFPFTPPPRSALSTYHFVSPVSTSALDPTARQGYTQQWNLTFEKQLRQDLGISLAYVGNHSIDMIATWQVNPAVYGPGATVGNTDSRRLYPGLSALGYATGWGFGNYNGLQFQATKRTGHGLTLLGNYVYSKCMDNTTDQVLGADAGGGAEYHKTTYKADYARCDFDQTHAANISFVYDFPKAPTFHGPASRLVNGWSYNAIISASSGLPFNVLSGRDNSLTGAPNNDFAKQLTANVARPAGADRVQQFFNTSAFTVNDLGTYGNMQRNALTGPGVFGFDMGLVKQTPITEQVGIQFRAEFFNVLNHANFANPNGTVTNVSFGKITSTGGSLCGGASGNACIGDPRVLQFALRLSF